MNADDLRAAVRESSDCERPDECPNDDRIWEAVQGGLERNERLRLIERVASCHRCALRWRLARELSQGAVADAVARPRRHLMRWAGAVAAVLLIAIVGYQLIEPKAPIYRDVETARIESRLGESALSRSEATLRWTPEAGATYRVTVSTESLDLLLDRRDLEANELTLPPGVLDRVTPGTALLWQVEARLPDGSLLRSPTFVQRVE